MIQVTFEKNVITIKGHAFFAKRGKDIVCSAVSALTQFVAEIFQSEQIGHFEKEKGALRIIVQQPNELSEKLTDYLHKALTGIEHDYPRNLKVEVKSK